MDDATDVTMLVKYSITDAAIAEMGDRFNHLEIEPGDAKSYALVRLAIGEIRTVRVGIEKERKLLKEDALRYGQKIDAEAKRITLGLREIEDSLKEKKAVIDDENTRIKEEAENKERERIEKIRGMISGISWYGEGLTNTDVPTIMDRIASVMNRVIEPTVFDEFTKEAEETKAQVLETLEKQLLERQRFERERLRVVTERKQLEKQKAEQERRVAEERKQAEAERKEIQEKIDAEREQLAKEKEAIDRERFKIQAEKEAKENAIREAKELEAREVTIKREAEAKAKRDAELAPDKIKLAAYYDGIMQTIDKHPEIKDTDMRDSMKQVKDSLENCIHAAVEF